MQVLDFQNNPNWFEPEVMAAFFAWATSPEIEQSGEARRQLGYMDGYGGEPAWSRNADYLRGWTQGQLMLSAGQCTEGTLVNQRHGGNND